MKHGKIILGLVAFAVTASSTVAFSAKKAFNNRHQLFTRTKPGSITLCNAASYWTVAGVGSNTIATKLYTKSTCKITWKGKVTVIF